MDAILIRRNTIKFLPPPPLRRNSLDYSPWHRALNLTKKKKRFIICWLCVYYRLNAWVIATYVRAVCICNKNMILLQFTHTVWKKKHITSNLISYAYVRICGQYDRLYALLNDDSLNGFNQSTFQCTITIWFSIFIAARLWNRQFLLHLYLFI